MQEAVQGQPIISARQLRVRYGEREILHGLDFDINHGETVVILGGSGSGKSTLLRTIVGLEKPHSGEILIKGTDMGKATTREISDLRKKMGDAAVRLAPPGVAKRGDVALEEDHVFDCQRQSVERPRARRRPADRSRRPAVSRARSIRLLFSCHDRSDRDQR